MTAVVIGGEKTAVKGKQLAMFTCHPPSSRCHVLQVYDCVSCHGRYDDEQDVVLALNRKSREKTHVHKELEPYAINHEVRRQDDTVSI